MRTGLNLCSWSLCRTCDVSYMYHSVRDTRQQRLHHRNPMWALITENTGFEIMEKKQKKTYLRTAPDSGPLSVAHTKHSHLYLA